MTVEEYFEKYPEDVFIWNDQKTIHVSTIFFNMKYNEGMGDDFPQVREKYNNMKIAFKL